MTALFRRSAAILMVSALALFAQGAEFSYDDPVFLKGIELVNQKKYAEAAVKWRDVLNRQPGHPGAYYFAGVSRFELGELDKAAYNFKRAFDYPDKGFNAYYYLGRIAEKQKKYDEARANYSKYLTLTQSANGIAEVKGRLARLPAPEPQAAQPAAEPAKPAAPAPEKAPEAAAPAPAKAASPEPAAEPAKAAAPEEKAAEKAPAYRPTGTLKHADAEYLAGRAENAEADYLEFLKSSPRPDDAAWAWYQLGNLYRGWRHDEALAAYDKVVRLYPKSRWARMAEWKRSDISWKFDHQNLLGE